MAPSRREPESMVLRLLESGETLTIEQVVERLPDLQWHQVFRAVKTLTERKKVIVRARGFVYELKPVRHGKSRERRRVACGAEEGTIPPSIELRVCGGTAAVPPGLRLTIC